MAINQGLEVIPVLNKIDLPAADPERVGEEIENTIGIDQSEILRISAKTGEGVEEVLDAIIQRIPAPSVPQTPELTAKALIFDSVYDKYKGVVNYVKVIEGSIQSGDTLHLIHSHTTITVPEVGFVNPLYQKDKKITAGQIGYIVTGLKSVRDAKIGDTMISTATGQHQALELNEVKRGNYSSLQPFAVEGFAKAKPYVYAGVYPVDSADYDKLKESFAKLVINDSAVEYDHESSSALGV